MHKIELLVEAFNLDILKSIVENGCDAVFIGDGIDNFSETELREAVKFVHDNNKKIYVAFNKIPHEKDLFENNNRLKLLGELNIDAIVAIEPGMVETIKKVLPNMEIHLGEQSNITNYETAKFWYNEGVKRIVVSKELSCEEIGQIRVSTSTELDIEALVHGSMLVSHSGRKLLSNYISNKSSEDIKDDKLSDKRYTLMEEKRPGLYFPIYEDERGTFLYNTEDLCMIEFIPQLIKSGITSLKIDGRLKSLEYITEAVKAYKIAIDEFYKDTDKWEFNPQWIEPLNNIENRKFTTAFYLDNN